MYAYVLSEESLALSVMLSLAVEMLDLCVRESDKSRARQASLWFVLNCTCFMLCGTWATHPTIFRSHDPISVMREYL